MSIFEDTNPRELKDLLRQIDQGESALPDFQRNFVWDPGETQELIVSIACNYPAGSLLRIRNTHKLFAYREFQGAPALNGHRPIYLVLDGQQRLTSLYQAFYGVGEHRYFLDLRGLLEGKDFEECIFHLRANHRRVGVLSNPTVQANQLVLPLSVLKDGVGGFGQWTLAAVKTLAQQDGADAAAALAQVQELGEIQGKWIQAIDDYRFPVVTLSDRTGADAVCTIFETLNRTGVKLSPFELLTARFWPHNINLRELWAKAISEHPIIEDMDVDPYYVLQSISLVARRTPSCKRSDVLDLSPNDITTWWDRAIDGLARGLRMLRDDCGVLIPKWLPYAAVVIPLAAVLAKHAESKGPEVAALRAKLIRWYWCSVIGQSYENAANSQAAKDVSELLRWLDGGAPPASVSEFRFDPRLLQSTTPRQRGLYRAAMGLILRKRPRDFHKGEHITGELMVERHIDDHHVFPDGYLKKFKEAPPQRLHDCILNRTLIDRQTNKSISDRAPSKYLPKIRKVLEPHGSLDAILASHLLPTGEDSPFTSDDFNAFLTWREAAMWRQIQEVTGAKETSDLLDDDMLEASPHAGGVEIEESSVGSHEAPASVGQEPDPVEIGQMIDKGELRTLMSAARRQNKEDIYRAVFRRLCALEGMRYDDPLERDFYEMLAAYEELLTEKHGRTTRAARTRQKLANKGLEQCLIDWATGGLTEGFELLIERGLPELTAEFLVVKHDSRFSPEVVEAARRRLAEHGGEPNG